MPPPIEKPPVPEIKLVPVKQAEKPTPGVRENQLATELGDVLAAKHPEVHADQTIQAMAHGERPKAPIEPISPQNQVIKLLTESGRLSAIEGLSTTSDAERSVIRQRLTQINDEVAQLSQEIKASQAAAQTAEAKDESTVNAPQVNLSEQKTKEHSPKNETLMHRSNEQIRRLARLIQEGKLPQDRLFRAKDLLEQQLMQREKLFYQMVSKIRPDVQPVEGVRRLYKARDSIYGSIYTIMDVGENVFAHKGLAEKMKYHSSSASTLAGESFLESSVVFSGSSAQDRINAFGGDIDMAEHMRVSAGTKSEAASIIADSIKSSIQQKFIVEDGKENQMELNFSRLKLGSYPEDSADPKLVGKSLSWTAAEIESGQKVISLANGQERIITLQQACENPGFFKLDYIGKTTHLLDGTADSTTGSVIEVTKLTSVLATTPDKKIVLIDNYPHPTAAVAFQEVYFQQPTPEYGLVEKVGNADSYIGYVNLMKDQIWHYSEPKHYNSMKVAKRLYNLLRTEGDIALSQELAEVFKTPASQMNQMVDRLGVAQEAAARGIDVSAQNEHMRSNLVHLLSSCSEPEAKEALQLINTGVATFGENSNISALVKKIVDRQVGTFIDSNSQLSARLHQVMAEKPAQTVSTH